MKKYFILLNIALLTIAIYFGVSASYRMLSVQMEDSSLSAPSSKDVLSSQEDTSQPLSHYNAITDRNLFKTKEKEKAGPEPTKIEEPLKPTDLKLKLWGTVSGDDRKRAYAVIEDTKEKKQNLYREDDPIPVQNATVQVKQILRGKVILTVNGNDESLEMEEKPLAQSTPEPFREPEVQPVASSDSQSIKLDRAKIEDAVNNVNNLMRQAKIRPHFKNGKPDGLTLSRIRPNSIFTELGLQSGDIITGVDGKKIESVDDALNFYQSLKSSPSVKLEIKRRGQAKTIDYNIE